MLEYAKRWHLDPDKMDSVLYTVANHVYLKSKIKLGSYKSFYIANQSSVQVGRALLGMPSHGGSASYLINTS